MKTTHLVALAALAVTSAAVVPAAASTPAANSQLQEQHNVQSTR